MALVRPQIQLLSLTWLPRSVFALTGKRLKEHAGYEVISLPESLRVMACDGYFCSGVPVDSSLVDVPEPSLRTGTI